MTPGFSLRRLFNRRRYMRALVATDPNQAVACCVEYWASRWRSTLEETPGVPEQLAYNGWVGTEIADGADTWRMLAAVPIDAIARSDLSPSASAQPGRSARRQTSRIMIAPRSCTVTDHPASELWCFDTRVGHRDTPHTEQFIGQCFQDLTQVLQLRGYCWRHPNSSLAPTYPRDTSFRSTTCWRFAKLPKRSTAANPAVSQDTDTRQLPQKNTSSQSTTPAQYGGPQT